VNYEPNSYGGPTERSSAREVAIALAGPAARTDYPRRDNDFEQAGLLYGVLKPDERARLVSNLAGHMKGIDRAVQVRQLGHFLQAHEEYGTRVDEALGIPIGEVRAQLRR
jgi:catalase